MPDNSKDKDQEKGDEVLRRLLKTPPDPKTGRGRDADEQEDKGGQGAHGDANRPRSRRSR
jgi:hypothetical protein